MIAGDFGGRVERSGVSLAAAHMVVTSFRTACDIQGHCKLPYNLPKACHPSYIALIRISRVVANRQLF